MAPSIPELIERWDGLAVVSRHVAAHDAWIFVALHDGTLGTPTGGTRMRVYERPEAGLLDAMRLAEGMTLKWASIGLPFGGGKAVLALSRELARAERRMLLADYGRLLDALCGSFATGEDLGTTPEDMQLLSRYTRYVHGSAPGGVRARDPGPFTARGVLAGIHAATARVFGERSLRGRTILIQGVGDVGLPLARLCVDAGAQVLVSDLDAGRAQRVADETAGQVVAPDDVYGTVCDVYAPSAVGTTLNARTVPRLRCRIVAGSANNQLEEPADAERLHEAGILYAPDYVINSGGALAFGLMARESLADEELMRRVDGLESVLREIFSEAAEGAESPFHAAQRRAHRVLERERNARRGHDSANE